MTLFSFSVSVVGVAAAIKLDSSFSFGFSFTKHTYTLGKMCNQNNLTQSLRETARRGLILFLYIYFLRFFLPLGLFFYYLFFIFSRNWFATHQRTFLLDFVAQITHTQHILSYPPRALHNDDDDDDDDANKNTTPLFDKTSAASSTDQLHLNQPLWQTTH